MRDKKPFFPIRQRTETLEAYCRTADIEVGWRPETT